MRLMLQLTFNRMLLAYRFKFRKFGSNKFDEILKLYILIKMIIDLLVKKYLFNLDLLINEINIFVQLKE